MHKNDVNPDIGWSKSPAAIEDAKLATKGSPAYPVEAAILLLLVAVICYIGSAIDPTPALPVTAVAQVKPPGSEPSQTVVKPEPNKVANRVAESRQSAGETATPVEQSVDQF